MNSIKRILLQLHLHITYTLFRASWGVLRWGKELLTEKSQEELSVWSTWQTLSSDMPGPWRTETWSTRIPPKSIQTPKWQKWEIKTTFTHLSQIWDRAQTCLARGSSHLQTHEIEELATPLASKEYWSMEKY